MAKVELIISDQRREDMLVGALEGGSNAWYWLGDEALRIIDEVCKDHKEPFSIRMWKAIQAGKTIPVHDVDNPIEKLGEINMQSIIEGEQLLAEKYIGYFMEIYSEQDDAATADAWFQFCVFKSIVYS